MASGSVATTPPMGASLPSRRDRAALRRPTALDEAAVQASDSAAWRTSPALEDPRTASAIARPAPLTRALARTLTEHLDSLTPPPSLAGSAAAAPAPAVYVPRRRSAPAVSGPLPVVATTTGAVDLLSEPSWTTGPTRTAQPPRSSEPSWTTGPTRTAPPLQTTGPSWTTEPVAPSPSAGALDALGQPDLPPPPPAAEVEAAVRARAARFPTAPVPPPVPDRAVPDPATGRSSVLVPPAALPAATRATPAALAAPAALTTPAARATAPASGPTAALTAADLAAVRAATAGLSPTPDTSTAGPTTGAASATTPGAAAASTASTSALHPDGRHGRTTARTTTAATARTGRTSRAGRTSRTGPPTRGADAATAGAGRRWHQRRALGVPVGLFAAAGALAVAVVVGVWSAPGHPDLSAALTSAGAAAAPGDPTPPAAAPAGGAASAAADDSGGQEAPAAAAGDGGSAAPAAPEAATSAAAPAAESSSAPEDAALIPTGDVTYEGFGTAKNTYVELGTADARDVREDLGSTFTQPAPGSKDWPGWYVAVKSFDGPDGGSVGCRIKDADGRVLDEQTAEGADVAMCVVGSPAGL